MADARDRRSVSDEIEIELVEKHVRDRISRNYQKERMAVGGRTHDRLGGDLPEAPARFSTMNGWPRRSDSH